MKNVKVGLLPLYIALYDSSSPYMRPKVEAFAAEIAGKLREQNLDVIENPICCVSEQFQQAIAKFESEGAEAIITLHLAYSPSLESDKILAGTKLPIVVLDTTPDYRFDPTESTSLIDYNHGIHGVQDMCNMMRRNGKRYVICAGHYQHSDVLARAAQAARIAAAWTRLSHSKIGLYGGAFEGMGDFQVSEEAMKALGVEVVTYPMSNDTACLDAVTQEMLDAELAQDKQNYAFGDDIPLDTYFATERVGLSVRNWIEKEQLTGFSMNFRVAGVYDCFPTMPFAEACKAMARGIGYAGEGDALTAAFVGALMKAYPETTFAEMFCPDWCGNRIYFSHMGEFNPLCTVKPHMIVKPFPFAPGFDPTALMAHMKGGKVCFADLAPTANGFCLVLAEGEMCTLSENIGEFENAVSGWFRPNAAVAHFLEEYSRAGGTHHGALVYGASADDLRNLAYFGNMECVVIR